MGMKKIPFLAEDAIDAFSPFPVDCSIMFVMTMVAINGSEIACARSATVPTAMTSGSSRKKLMICGANARHRAEAPVRMMVPYFTQKK